jgi:hypothetical protein
MNMLTRKDAEWTWAGAQQTAFDALKLCITSKPVLAHPHKQFDLEVDASGFAVGAILLQKGEDSKKHPIAFYSATLNKAE